MPDLDLTQYKARLIEAARAGLVAAAPAFTAAAEQKARDTFPGQTGATFAGGATFVSGDPGAFSVAQLAIQEVLTLNPDHAYSEDAPEPPEGVVRLWGTVMTDYIDQLEADPDHAFLARIFDEEQGAIKAAVDRAIGGVT